MSNTRSKLISAVALLAVGTTGFAADVRGPAVARPVAVRAAIERPLPPSITPGEAARIRYQIKEHKQMQRRAHADGVVTRREQAILDADAAQVRRLIHKAKTN